MTGSTATPNPRLPPAFAREVSEAYPTAGFPGRKQQARRIVLAAAEGR